MKDANTVIEWARKCATAQGKCFACPYDEYTDCKKALIADLVGVIDRKDRRIEELEERIAIMTEDDGLPISW